MTSAAGHRQANFEAVLTSLRRVDGADAGAATGRKRFATAIFPADGMPERGFAAAAERAFEDFAAEGTAPEPPKPLPSDAPDAIASELALSGIADPAALRGLRRRFLWANHPDRRPDLPRDLANRRVAIANMLIDGALRAHRPSRR